MHGGGAERILGRYAAEFHDAAFATGDSAVAFFVEPFGDLRHDRDRDLRGRYRANVEADRRMDAGKIGVGLFA